MKSISQLVRRNTDQIINSCRARRSGVDMMLRKQYRRAKKINYFSKDYTNESNPNAWFNARRYKALVQHYQQMRNMHRGTNPISPQLKQEIAQKFTQDSHWQYWNYRNHLKQHQQELQLLTSIDINKEILTLPAKLRQQVQGLTFNQLPHMIQPQFHYSEQYQVSLPADEKYRRNLILRIRNPPRDKSLEEDQE